MWQQICMHNKFISPLTLETDFVVIVWMQNSNALRNFCIGKSIVFCVKFTFGQCSAMSTMWMVWVIISNPIQFCSISFWDCETCLHDFQKQCLSDYHSWFCQICPQLMKQHSSFVCWFTWCSWHWRSWCQCCLTLSKMRIVNWIKSAPDSMSQIKVKKSNKPNWKNQTKQISQKLGKQWPQNGFQHWCLGHSNAWGECTDPWMHNHWKTNKSSSLSPSVAMNVVAPFEVHNPKRPLLKQSFQLQLLQSAFDNFTTDSTLCTKHQLFNHVMNRFLVLKHKHFFADLPNVCEGNMQIVGTNENNVATLVAHQKCVQCGRSQWLHFQPFQLELNFLSQQNFLCVFQNHLCIVAFVFVCCHFCLFSVEILLLRVFI